MAFVPVILAFGVMFAVVGVIEWLLERRKR
jgi:hypothetical protein